MMVSIERFHCIQDSQLGPVVSAVRASLVQSTCSVCNPTSALGGLPLATPYRHDGHAAARQCRDMMYKMLVLLLLSVEVRKRCGGYRWRKLLDCL